MKQILPCRKSKTFLHIFSEYKYSFMRVILGYPNWENDEFANNEEAEQYAKKKGII